MLQTDCQDAAANVTERLETGVAAMGFRVGNWYYSACGTEYIGGIHNFKNEITDAIECETPVGKPKQGTFSANASTK